MKDIVMIGYAGLSDSLSLLMESRDELKARFSEYFLDRAEKAFRGAMLSREEAEELKRELLESSLAESVINAENGIYAALWDLGEELESGLSVNLKDIPVLQEGIELANYLDRNPYLADSEGVLVMATEEKKKIFDFFQKRGIPTKVIGSIIDRNKRVVVSGERETFLTPERRR